MDNLFQRMNEAYDEAIKMCPAGCGERYDMHPRNSTAYNACPWMIALHESKLKGKALEDYCNKNWREEWRPQIYDWVALECGRMITIHQIRYFDLSKEEIEYCGNDFISKKDFIRPATSDERQRGILAQLENQEYSIGKPSVKFSNRGNTEKIIFPEVNEVSAHPELSSKEFFEQAMRPKGWPKPWITGLTGTIDITPVEKCPCCNGSGFVHAGYEVCPECNGIGDQLGKTIKARI